MEQKFFLRPSRRDLPTLSTRAGYLGHKQSSPVIVPEVRMLPVEETATPDLTSIALDPIFDGNVIEPVMKTPSKDLKRKMDVPSAPTTPTDQPAGSGSPVKKTKVLLPSPGKRWLARASQSSEETQMETIDEVAEMVALGEVCHKPVQVRSIYFAKI